MKRPAKMVFILAVGIVVLIIAGCGEQNLLVIRKSRLILNENEQLKGQLEKCKEENEQQKELFKRELEKQKEKLEKKIEQQKELSKRELEKQKEKLEKKIEQQKELSKRELEKRKEHFKKKIEQQKELLEKELERQEEKFARRIKNQKKLLDKCLKQKRALANTTEDYVQGRLDGLFKGVVDENVKLNQENEGLKAKIERLREEAEKDR